MTFVLQPGTVDGVSVLAEKKTFFSKSQQKIVINYTNKKEIEVFLIDKEIQMGSVAKSYTRKDFLTYEEMRKFNHI